MTCKNTSCKWEFCWVCSGPWKEHSGSYYNCNKFDPDKESEGGDGKKKKAKASLSIIIPCVIAAVVLVAAVLFLIRKRKTDRTQHRQASMPDVTDGKIVDAEA